MTDRLTTIPGHQTTDQFESFLASTQASLDSQTTKPLKKRLSDRRMSPESKRNAFYGRGIRRSTTPQPRLRAIAQRYPTENTGPTTDPAGPVTENRP